MPNIFILSQHRTGSTLLRNLLNENSQIVMAFDEMNLYEPMRKTTLDRLLSDASDAESLVSMILEKKVYGTFWQEFSKSGISVSELRERLDQCGELTPRAVLQAVLVCLAETKGVKFSGVKYPLHFSRIGLLRDWFPDCKIIMLFRNPKSMIASKLNDPATCARKRISLIHRFIIHYFTLLLFSWEFVRSVSIYEQYCDRVHKVNYESLVIDQRAIIEGICQYCGVAFESKMLSVSGKESSFGVEGRKSVSAASLDKYKQVLSRFDQWLIDLLTLRSYRKVQ